MRAYWNRSVEPLRPISKFVDVSGSTTTLAWSEFNASGWNVPLLKPSEYSAYTVAESLNA